MQDNFAIECSVRLVCKRGFNTLASLSLLPISAKMLSVHVHGTIFFFKFQKVNEYNLS